MVRERKILQIAFGSLAAVALALPVATPVVMADEASQPTNSIAVRLARAEVALATANLRRVEGMNRRVAGTVPDEIVAAYRGDLAGAKAKLARAQASGKLTTYETYLLRAETDARNAQDKWQRAKAANAAASGVIGDAQLERLRQQVNLAMLTVEAGKSAESPAARLQWQLDYLLRAVHRLDEANRIQTGSSTGRLWWWGY